MTFDETHSNTASNGDSTHVESSDHKTRMTFTETKLVGSEGVGAAQTDANLINPWGMSESSTSPFWISDNGSGLASIYQVTDSGVMTNFIPPITIAVPPGQTPGKRAGRYLAAAPDPGARRGTPGAISRGRLRAGAAGTG